MPLPHESFELMLASINRVVLVCFFVSILSSCSNLLTPQKQSIDAVFNIQVKDPLYRRLTEATTKASISASGRFKDGNYTIKDKSLRIDPNTTFTLEFIVPIDNPNFISTVNAVGKLNTSRPLVMNNIALPKEIVLQKGKATADVDLVQTLGAFFFNVLADQASLKADGGDPRKMLQSMHIKNMVLSLKPDSYLRFGKKEIHVGAGSKFELTDVNIDNNFNFQGQCLVQMKFLTGSKWIGKRTDFTFNSGGTTLFLNAKRTDNELALSLEKKEQEIDMGDCVIRWGKNKRSSTHSKRCLFKVQDLLWSKQQGIEDPSLKMATSMLMEDTHLNLITDTQETDAHFPGTVPATLKVDLDEKGRATEFNTHQVETAQQARITIHRPASTVVIHLDNASVGPFSVDKFGQVNFSLSEGEAKLKQLVWTSAKKSFSVTTTGHQAVLSLPDGMELSSKGKPGSTRMSLPIVLKLGKATLSGPSGQLKLANINGTMLVDVDEDVHIRSDMDFSIENSSLIGKQPCNVVARGFDLSATDGQAVAHLKSCSIDWSDETLKNAIKEHLPKNKIFQLNKTLPQEKWRYRNAVIKTVTLNNLELKDTKSEGTNRMDFNATGNVSVSGTVDKGGLMTAFTHESDKWETRPWSASGHATATGTVNYKLVPGASLATSVFAYDLAMQIPIPDDMELDWSAVSKGIICSAEKAIISSHMKKISVPFKYSSTFTVGDTSDRTWKDVKISKLVCAPSATGTKMTFSATAAF
ncbi:MAG: hypothetical protein K2W82_07705 [Candidatus Obscuribacterales bacterium]|nr:hypothetical protein [Candidatus Obscuribacterales bacterium]